MARPLWICVAVLCCALFASARPGQAREFEKACPGFDVTAFTVSSRPDSGEGDPAPEAIRILQSGSPITVVAVGPVLTYADSKEVRTQLTCTEKGLLVRAAITRSSTYSGSFLKNRPWRPAVQWSLIIRKAAIEVEIVWSMYLRDGSEVHRADPGETFPYMLKRSVARFDSKK
jgi:hypothetical protein